MDTIPFGTRSGYTVPRVSMGCMRLPGDIDEAAELIRYGIDKGMRYLDTSMGYGESEKKIGVALKGGYREKVILSTKWSPWIKKVEERDAADVDSVLRHIEASMKRLDVDCLDFYQVWNIMNRDNYDAAVKKGGFVDGIREAKKRGLVKHIGFTSHDSPKNLLTYLDEVDWCEILLVTYNYLNTAYTEVLAKAHEKGIGTIIMNPMGGGKLAEPSSVFSPMAERAGCSSTAEMALRYVLANTSIDTMIVGISKKKDVDDAFTALERGPIAQDNVAALNERAASVSNKSVNFCTRCGYCMPCPQDVNIPEVMSAIYHARFLDMKKAALSSYKGIGTNGWVKGKNASACINCGECVPKCTQKLAIPDEMEWAAGQFK
ncbi:MAG: aldo/keto reductase [Spirochaetes bacterium]|nr:aldo/keto reductase [Spirochaetota bacterium]